VSTMQATAATAEINPGPMTTQATFLSLPSELLTRVALHLSLHEYSRLGRTCKFLHAHFHRELIMFLRHVYGLSVRSGSLILFAYVNHLQYRAPRLLDRILDEFFVDVNETPNPSGSRLTTASRQAHNSRWPTYWSVLYSLDKAPPLEPPILFSSSSTSTSGCTDDQVGACFLRPDHTVPCHKCGTVSFNGSVPETSPNPKLQFLEKYAARMNAKFASRSGRVTGSRPNHFNGRRNEWHLSDVRQKKTYRMLIMQNIRYGDVALLRFYLEKYGAPTNGVVKFTPDEQVNLMQDRDLMSLLHRYGIRVVVAE